MPASPRFRPLVALRALRALANDPDDLPKVFTVIESMPGRAPERMLARMRASADGRRLLQAKPDLGARLADRDALRALPPGTLGRAYLELALRAGISPQGIVDASVEGTLDASGYPADLRFTGDRMRDTHDLWHVVTGYGTDLVGEASLLSFTHAQTWHPGVAFVAALAIVHSLPGARPVMIEAHRRGRQAAWLPAVPWEELLDRPLEDVRKMLRIGPPPSYVPVSSEEALAARAAA
jgi:ubiquinone biosynthesis protein COQ4